MKRKKSDKRGKRTRLVRAGAAQDIAYAGEAYNGFVRGFVAAGLVAVMGSKRSREKSLHLALQGGTAMASGVACANALQRNDYSAALISMAGGVAGLYAVNRLFSPSSSHVIEVQNEQEKT